jgi:hypothetical protein
MDLKMFFDVKKNEIVVLHTIYMKIMPHAVARATKCQKQN